MNSVIGKITPHLNANALVGIEIPARAFADGIKLSVLIKKLSMIV